MITDYIESAMKNANYEILDDKTYYGEIPILDGVWANSSNLEKCREELQEVLEGWILVRLKKGLPVPEIDNINLAVKELV